MAEKIGNLRRPLDQAKPPTMYWRESPMTGCLAPQRKKAYKSDFEMAIKGRNLTHPTREGECGYGSSEHTSSGSSPHSAAAGSGWKDGWRAPGVVYRRKRRDLFC